ncbi:hypothetical protein AB0R12_40545, partial [Streptomyces niveus]
MSTSTTPLTTADPDTPPGRSPLISWLAVLSVTTGIFSVVTTEILPTHALGATRPPPATRTSRSSPCPVIS